MQTKPFVPAHLSGLKLGVAEQEQHALLGPLMFGALQEWTGPAWSLIGDDDSILGCFGLLLAGGRGILWAALSDAARANRFGLHRAARRHLEQAERLIPDGPILAAVRSGYEPGRRWVRHLGLNYDGELPIGPERYERYVKWPHQHR